MGNIYRGQNASVKILVDDVEIGEALFLKHVHVEIATELEPYYEIENPNVVRITLGKQKISGTLTSIWINTAKLRLLGIPGAEAPLTGYPDVASSPFSWDSNIPFKLEIQAASNEAGPILILDKCQFIKSTINIPQDGFLEEDYDFISIGTPIVEYNEIVIEEPIDWGYFSQNFIWILEPIGLEGGGYITIHTIHFSELKFIDGGGYFSDPKSCAIPKGTDALVNGDFETGSLDPWMRSHAGDFTIDAIIFFEGLFSARYEGTDLSGAGAYIRTEGIMGGMPIPVSVDGCLDASSEFSIYLKSETTGKSINKISICYSDLSATNLNYTAPDTNWHKIDLLPHAEEGKTIIALQISFLGDGTKWWLDFARLIP